MKYLKRILAAALCAVMLVSLLSGLSLTAAADGTYTRSQMETLIRNTAYAYFLKGPDCQYDSYVLSGAGRTKSCTFRLTLGLSPEDLSPERRLYTVCSSFPHEVYYNVFDNPLLKHVLSPADLAGTDPRPADYANTEANTGLRAGTLSMNDMKHPLGLISLTSNYGAYAKKVARVGETDTYEQGWIGHDGIAYFYGGGSYEDITTAEYNTIKSNLRPGDIISVVRGDEDDDDGENSGHTMMYLGYYNSKHYLIHSSGGKYNNDDNSFTGKTYTGNTSGAIREGVWTNGGTAAGDPVIGYDIRESGASYSRNGTICIQPYDDVLGFGHMYGPQYKASDPDRKIIKQFVVMRPIDRLIDWTGTAAEVSDSDLFPKDGITHSGYARRAYPGLEVTTVADKTQYNDVQPGETLTYSWIVENDTNLSSPVRVVTSRSYSNMELTLPLPRDTVYVGTTVSDTASPSTPGTTTYDEAHHTVTVSGFRSASGKTFRVNVTVRIPDGTPLGKEIVLPRGELTGANTGEYFELATLTHTVGGAHPTGFDGISAGSVVNSGARSKMAVANDVYAAAGYQLDLPSTQEFINSVLTYAFVQNITSRRMQSRLLEPGEITDPGALQLRKMIVPGYIGGKKLLTPNSAGVKDNMNRLRDFDERFLQPGDILVYAYTGLDTEYNYRTIATGSSTSERVYVYLGDSRYAWYDNEGTFTVTTAPLRVFMYSGATPKGELTGFDRDGNASASNSRIEWSEVLTQAFRYSYFFCLRPSLVYTTLPAMNASVSAAYTVTTSGGVTTGYPSVASAISVANASAGSTLTLHEDAALTADQVFYGGTLDLNGHTLSTGAYSLILGSGSSSQTLRNGTVTGSGDVVACADSSTSAIENVKLFAGGSGTALVSSDSAHVTLENVELASANTSALPVRTGSSGTQANWTFTNDVTVLVPSALADAYTGNGAALGTDVSCWTIPRNAYYQIADAAEESTYRPVVFTKDPAAENTTTETRYASLSEALITAGTGDTVHLLRDVHTADLRETGRTYGRISSKRTNKSYAFGLSQSVTLDFGGKTVYGDAESVNSTPFFLAPGTGSTITFRNGTIHAQTNWAINVYSAPDFHLKNMKVYADNYYSIVLSDGEKKSNALYVEDGSEIVAGLHGYDNQSTGRNSAIEVRYGSVTVRGGSKVGSLTGFAVKPFVNKGTAESPDVTSLTVEDGSLFTGRYAYTSIDTAYGYYNTDFDGAKMTATLTFLSDSDPTHYVREQHAEETIVIPGSTAIVAADRTVKYEGVASNKTTGVQYDTLAEAFAAATSGQTVALNRSLSLTADLTVPSGVTLDLDEYTMTVPAGRTLDASAGAMTAAAEGRLAVAGSVRYSATPADRLPDEQVQMSAGGAYGNVTTPASEELAGQTVVPEPDMSKSLSLNLNDMVVINHYLADSGSVYTNESFALVDGEKVAMQREGTNWYLPVRESPAKEMGRESTVQPVGVDSAGVYHLGKPSTLSIRWYAERLIGATDWSTDNGAKLGRAMIGMLNYGAAAQNYFSHETGDLANKNLTETEQARMTVYTPAKLAEYRVNTREKSDPENLYYASSCVLGSSQALRFYLNLRGRDDLESLTFRVNYRNYNGAERTITKSFAELEESTTSGIYYFEVSGMAAADVKTDVTLTVEKAGSAIATVTDSILSYCARVHDGNPSATALVNLTDAVLIYGLSARDHFYRPVAQPELAENELPMN